jgi:hypothetical protein
MNKLLIASVAIATLIASTTCAQKMAESKIPANIVKAFKAKYPKTEKVKWELEKGNYEAEFELNEVETSVLLDAKGNITETETEIEYTQLPPKVKEYLMTKLGNKKITEAAVIVDAKGTKMYEAEVGKKDYLFDENGKFLK